MNIDEFRKPHEKAMNLIWHVKHSDFDEYYSLLQDKEVSSMYDVHHYFKIGENWQVSYDICGLSFQDAYQYLVKEGIR